MLRNKTSNVIVTKKELEESWEKELIDTLEEGETLAQRKKENPLNKYIQDLLDTNDFIDTNRIIYRLEEGTEGVTVNVTENEITRIFGTDRKVIDNVEKLANFIVERYFEGVGSEELEDITIEEFILNYRKDNKDTEFLKSL